MQCLQINPTESPGLDGLNARSGVRNFIEIIDLRTEVLDSSTTTQSS